MNTTSNKDLLIFIPYFLPDHSYGGPIVSVNALINTIGFRKRIFLYSTSLFFSSQKKFSKMDKLNRFSKKYKVGRCAVVATAIGLKDLKFKAAKEISRNFRNPGLKNYLL